MGEVIRAAVTLVENAYRDRDFYMVPPALLDQLREALINAGAKVGEPDTSANVFEGR